MEQHWSNTSSTSSHSTCWNKIKNEGFQRLEDYLDTGRLPQGQTQLFPYDLYSQLYTLLPVWLLEVAVYTTAYLCALDVLDKELLSKTIYNLSNDSGNGTQQSLYDGYVKSICDYAQSKALPSLYSKVGFDLLEELAHRWNNHKIYVKQMSKFFGYLDRTYVKHKSCKPVSNAGISVFRDEVLEKKKEDTRNAVLAALHDDRSGKQVDVSLIKCIVQIYIDLGNDGDKKEEKLDFYKQELHKYVVYDAVEYYTHLSADWITVDSCSEYLLKGEAAILAEKERCERYLHNITSQSIQSGVQQAIFYNRMREFLNKETSLNYMLENDLRQDMKLIYFVFRRMKEGLEAMSRMFKAFVIKRGSALINECVQLLENTSDPEQEGAATLFVQTVLDLNDNFKEILTQCFSSSANEGGGVDSCFNTALKEAFESLINPNIGTYSFAFLLASFCDKTLTESGHADNKAEIEGTLDRVAAIFNYVIDKDLFEGYYRSHLARRLLSNISSKELEESMIAKLKMKCGSPYTDKLEGMLNDLAAANELQTAFHDEFCAIPENAANLNSIDFSVQVLHDKNWPTYFQRGANLPRELEQCRAAFERFYKSKQETRKIAWVSSLGSITMTAKFKEKYDLQCNSDQACLLLLFNTYSSLSCTKIRKLLRLDGEVVESLVASLVFGKYKILQQSQPTALKSSDGSQQMTSTGEEVYRVNTSFSCENKHIQLTMPVKEDVTTKERVEEDRSASIEAVLVRIMKFRKIICHNDLMAEATSQLSWFQPSSWLIKMRIERLLAGDYMMRDPSNPDVYRYKEG